MRNALLLLVKDLRLLRRSPLLVAVLVVYPVVVALLVSLALGGSERKPQIGFVNRDDSGRTVQIGDRRVGVDDYVERLRDDVDLLELGPEEAARALDEGRVAAVVTLPERFIDNLVLGADPPVIQLVTSPRAGLEGDAIERSLEAAVFRFNQRIARDYVGQIVLLSRLIVDGGRIELFGVSGEALGIERSRALVDGLKRDLLALPGGAPLAARLDPLLNFIVETGNNIGLAARAASAISSPIQLETVQSEPGREPLSAFGVAAALLVSLGLVGVLLAASALSGEREDNALVRLARGLVSPGSLIGQKMVFAAIGCLAVGMVLLGAVALLTSLAVGRWALWAATLVLAGLAFGAFGVLVGAVARETRAALLAGLMLALPLLFVGLVPGNEAASAVSALFAFGPAFDAFLTLLADPSLSGDLGLTLAHLAVVAAVFGAAAAVVLRWRARA